MTRFSRIINGATLLIALLAPLHATQLVRVAVEDYRDFERLQAAGLDLTHLSPDGMVEVALRDDSDRARLNSLGLNYYVAIEDVESFFARRLGAARRDDMGGYMTFAEIVARMNELREIASDLVSEPVVIGRSLQDRPIYAVKVSDNPDEDEEDEPEALYTSLIHAREVITAEVLFGVIEHLIGNYGADDRITRLVDERQLWFILCHNPDGYYENERSNPDGGGMWRKNMRNNGDGTIGVDLNRNFGFQWGFDNVGSSPSGNSETYRGPSAFSEPETDAVRRWVNNRRFSISIYFHSYSNLCLYPVGYDFLQPPDLAVFNALGRRMALENDYLVGAPWEIIYRVNGSSDDWLYFSDEHRPIYAYTVEVGSVEDFFWPPLNRVEPLVRENIETCLAVAEFADLPSRVLRPPAVTGFEAIYRPEADAVHLVWDEVEDDDNPPSGYRVRVQRPVEPIFDDAESGGALWERVNFAISQVDQHSGQRSYRASIASIMATLTLREEIPLPDTIWAWVNYNLRTQNGHGLACEISSDGFEWHPLPGDSTRNLVLNDQNLGPVLTGNSNGWRRAWWTTGGEADAMRRIRFRHYQFGSRRNDEIAFIDDIGPLAAYEDQAVLADSLDATEWDDRFRGDEFEYQVQAFDAEGDRSFWSPPRQAGARPGVTLALPRGWSLVSAPVSTDPPSVASIFARLIDDDRLILIKNGFGRFILPDWNIDQLGDWNPLAGYHVWLTEAAEVVFAGELVAAESPIPLLTGWNTIAYLPETPLDAPEALASVRDNLLHVKDGAGRFWAVEEGFNNLGDLAPGNGYKLKMRRSDTLIYPEVEGIIRHRIRFVAASNPIYDAPGPENQSLILEWLEPPLTGTIQFFDGEGNICGALETGLNSLQGLRQGAAIWGETEPGGSGYAEGERIRALWRPIEGEGSREVRLMPVSGPDRFTRDGLTLLMALLEPDPMPARKSILNAHPNPFNARTTISIETAPSEPVDLRVYDLAGRLVGGVRLQSRDDGALSWDWNAGGHPAGLYVVQARIGADLNSAPRKLKLLLLP